MYLGSDTWWQFTFEREVLIEKVEIYNRIDCCGFRINNALVELYGEYESSSIVSQICGRVDSNTEAIRMVVCSK